VDNQQDQANKTQRAQQAAAQTTGASPSGEQTSSLESTPAPPSSSDTPGQPPANPPPPIAGAAKPVRRRWAILIQRIYQVDPLRCPQCGGAMKIIALIEARQEEVLRKILQHCGLWHDPPARAPPKPPTPSRPQGSVPQRDSGFVVEPDGEFLEHTRRQRIDQPELPWEP
jgi:hypothetical protein